jgi:type 1 glutamine amidotransferase
MNDGAIYLVCGGKFHDFSWVQQELKKHAERSALTFENCYSDYEQLPTLKSGDSIVTYTADLLPSAQQENNLHNFLHGGGRWLALHGTNSKVEIDERGYADSPRIDSKFMQMLGSQFLAHPPKQAFEIQITEPNHPLLADMESFIVEDELYFIDPRGDLEVLLHAQFNGKAMRGFKHRDYFSDAPRPIMYIRRWGEGEVLYLNLGHSRGH